MSDTEKLSEKEQMDEVKPDGEQDRHNEPSPSTPAHKAEERQGDMSDAGKMRKKENMDVEKGKHNDQSPSTQAENGVTADDQDDNQRKMLEAVFQFNRGQVCQQMWNIFSSK